MAGAATAKEPVDAQAPCQSLPRLRASGSAGAPPPLPLPGAAQLLTCVPPGARITLRLRRTWSASTCGACCGR
jgi:hypothetical protein